MVNKKLAATVFIPTWFGEVYLDQLLDRVFSQRVDFNYEVLIFDTSSTDKTPEIIEKYAKKHANLRHKTITKKEYGHGRTRQAAAVAAKGDIVVYLAQDAIPAHDRWLYEMVKPFSLNDKIVGVVGKQDPRPKCVPLLKYEIRSVFGNLGPDFGTTIFYKDDYIKNQATYDMTAFYSDVNSAARRSFLVNEIPYKDVSYAEDQLFGRDVIDAGYMKAYAARANVVHSNDVSLKEYKNRLFDEVLGLRRVGIQVEIPRKKLILKQVVLGSTKDALKTLRDSDYSLKRKLFWLAVNPLYHIEKWRGIRIAAKIDMNDSESGKKYSLESLRERKQ